MPINHLITRIVGRAAAIFQTIERQGRPIPPGPVLVVANHPNSLLDPLVIFRVAGRPTRPLAKAPLFEQRLVGTLLRGLGGLPVYRPQDDASQMHRNEDTFRGAVAALRAADAVQIYPEGKSHSEPALLPLRTGAARIALGAEAESNWQLGLRLVPVGLTYDRKSLFRGRVVAVIGEAFTIVHLRELYDSDAQHAVRVLTDAIAEALHDVTLNLAQQRDAGLIDMAERLYVREKGVSGFRDRDSLAERLPRLRAFARGLAWLREQDPARHQRLTGEVARYRRRTLLLGSRDGDVPPRYPVLRTLRYVGVNAVLLLLLLPIAIAGTLIWYPTYLAPRVTLRAVKPDFEAIATYKIATGFVAVPLTLLVCAVIGGVLDGLQGALYALLAVPFAGLVAIDWHERLQQVREDARLFFRLLFRADQRQRLARDRAALVAEFDAIMAESGLFAAAD